MKKKLKVLLAFDCPFDAPRGYDFKEEFKDWDWCSENDSYRALKANGYDVRLLGISNDIRILIEEIKENRPDVVFNQTEVFNRKSRFDKNIVWMLEMLGVPYTGASPASLLICNDKALSKKILSFHKIKVPRFYTFYRNHKVWLPKKLRLPAIVKPLREEASRGISQASVIDSEDAFIERIRFIHENMKMDAIAEEYIDGREFYISVLGNKRIKVLPVREMKFGQFPEDEARIATFKAKWDYDYREKWGIKNVFAGRLPEGWEEKIQEVCKKAYRVLNMKCYARFDIRVTPQAKVYIIEANANPNIEKCDELGQSAEKANIPYAKLIQKIVNLAFKRGA
ncbi:MAG: ATP-grasp domain-containing protein [Candidatus Omnitrophica bacterium]|nr:ATP-grasp domain-containing protein [Candidatus Omnitrophota bacterium]